MSGIENKSQFAWNVHSYLCDFIKFGDAKAVFICGLSGSLVAGLIQLVDWQRGATAESILGAISVILFCVAFLCGFAAIWPNLFTLKSRKKKSHPNQLEGDGKETVTKGFVFWKCILAHGNAKTFVNEMEGLSNSDPFKHVSHHNYELAEIADRKYSCITWGSRFLLAALLAVLVFSIAKWAPGSELEKVDPNSNSTVSFFNSSSCMEISKCRSRLLA
jgi:hypothetical protein